MTISYLFPGQGSQVVGMGKDLYSDFSEAREVFDRADEALNTKLSTLCFEGPENELRETANAQPAILAVSLAYLKILQSRGLIPEVGEPSFLAGHSLGEYTALIAANVLDFDTGIQLVRERGQLMQQASANKPGGMAAVIGLDEYVCEEVCVHTGTQIANINSLEQIVLSGSKEALVHAMDLARARGARKVIPLEVSGAFHSELMRTASDKIATKIASLPLNKPSVPIVANCSATPLNDVTDLKQELVHQLCHCVRWHDSVQYMVDSGVSTFVEVGPGKVLSALAKRLDQDVQVISAADTIRANRQ